MLLKHLTICSERNSWEAPEQRTDRPCPRWLLPQLHWGGGGPAADDRHQHGPERAGRGRDPPGLGQGEPPPVPHQQHAAPGHRGGVPPLPPHRAHPQGAAVQRWVWSGVWGVSTVGYWQMWEHRLETGTICSWSLERVDKELIFVSLSWYFWCVVLS